MPSDSRPRTMPELFSRAIDADGILGDAAIGADLDELIGTTVSAKRLGWDEGDEDDPDRTPYGEMDYDSPDLTGELTALQFHLPDGSPGTAWEVGGQPADPATVRPAA